MMDADSEANGLFDLENSEYGKYYIIKHVDYDVDFQNNSDIMDVKVEEASH